MRKYEDWRHRAAKCDRVAHDLLGMVDCGNADVFVSME